MKKNCTKICIEFQQAPTLPFIFKFEHVTVHYLISVIGIDTAFPQKKE